MSTILVADDEPILRWMLVAALSDEGYRVLPARDGREAVELACGEPTPDLFLMDIRMPRMDGRKAAAWLREDSRTRGIPIVLMSAGIHLSHHPDGVLFVPKPFDFDRLLALIARLLSQKLGDDGARQPA